MTVDHQQQQGKYPMKKPPIASAHALTMEQTQINWRKSPEFRNTLDQLSRTCFVSPCQLPSERQWMTDYMGISLLWYSNCGMLSPRKYACPHADCHFQVSSVMQREEKSTRKAVLFADQTLESLPVSNSLLAIPGTQEKMAWHVLGGRGVHLWPSSTTETPHQISQDSFHQCTQVSWFQYRSLLPTLLLIRDNSPESSASQVFLVLGLFFSLWAAMKIALFCFGQGEKHLLSITASLKLLVISFVHFVLWCALTFH